MPERVVEDALSRDGAFKGAVLCDEHQADLC
jgi:hypothetical protein